MQMGIYDQYNLYSFSNIYQSELIRPTTKKPTSFIINCNIVTLNPYFFYNDTHDTRPNRWSAVCSMPNDNTIASEASEHPFHFLRFHSVFDHKSSSLCRETTYSRDTEIRGRGAISLNSSYIKSQRISG